MWLSCGKNTSKRPDKLICVVKRAPLVPIGSLMTCTNKVCPSNTCFSMGASAIGASPFLPALSGSEWRALMLLSKSATCKNAARSKPMSMKADCIPGNTRDTLPKYTLPTKPISKLRSMCSSCTALFSTTATRVSWGDQLIKISCCRFGMGWCCSIGVHSFAITIPAQVQALNTRQNAPARWFESLWINT